MVATTPRVYHQQMVHFLRKSITFADDGTAVAVGSIPAGSLVHKPMSGVHVTTAFNAGTNNFLDVGPTTNDDLWGTDLSLVTTTFVPLDEAVGTYLCTVDTDIIATVDLTGTAATAGAAEVVICYIPDTDG